MKGTDNAGADPGGGESLPAWNVVKSGIDKETIGRGNECNSKHVEDKSNTIGCSKSKSILKNKNECVPSCSTEVLACDGDLNISILGNKLDEPLKAVKDVAGGEKKALDHGIFLVCLFDLFPVVLEDDSDELNESDQEGAESDGAEVVSEDPVEATHERAATVAVRGGAEVPKGASS